MPDLNLGPAPQSSSFKSIAIAFVILAAVAIAVFYLNPRKTAEARVTRVALFPVQTPSTEQHSVGSVIGQPSGEENDLYVVLTLHTDNKLRLPIYINGIDLTYTAADGSVRTEHDISNADIKRLEEIFPVLTSRMPAPLDFNAAVPPQSPSEGQILFHFQGFTPEIWKARRSATLLITLAHQNPLSISLPQ